MRSVDTLTSLDLVGFPDSLSFLTALPRLRLLALEDPYRSRAGLLLWEQMCSAQLSALAGLRALKVLRLQCLVHSRLLAHLAGLQALCRLELYAVDELCDDHVRELAALCRLERLLLGTRRKARLTGRGLAQLAGLGRLRHLALGDAAESLSADDPAPIAPPRNHAAPAAPGPRAPAARLPVARKGTWPSPFKPLAFKRNG